MGLGWRTGARSSVSPSQPLLAQPDPALLPSSQPELEELESLQPELLELSVVELSQPLLVVCQRLGRCGAPDADGEADVVRGNVTGQGRGGEALHRRCPSE